MQALRERFGLRHGQFFAFYLFKNLNWYLNGQWFGFGDLTQDNIDSIKASINPGEVFEAGWKELPPDSKNDDFFGDGGGCWITITTEAIVQR